MAKEGGSKSKESLDLAREHIRIAQDNILETTKSSESVDPEKAKRILFFLERTENEIDDLVSKIYGAFSIVFILGGLGLLSPRITGNAVGNLMKTNQSLIAVILLIVGISFLFLWINKKTNKK